MKVASVLALAALVAAGAPVAAAAQAYVWDYVGFIPQASKSVHCTLLPGPIPQEPVVGGTCFDLAPGDVGRTATATISDSVPWPVGGRVYTTGGPPIRFCTTTTFTIPQTDLVTILVDGPDNQAASPCGPPAGFGTYGTIALTLH